MTPDKHTIRTVLDHYTLDQSATTTLLTGGKINLTWLVSSDTSRYILQRVNDAHESSKRAEDTATVLESLSEKGWEMPTVYQTINGAPYVHNDGTWRLLRFIEADTSPSELTPESAQLFGKLLAQLHTDLSVIDLRLGRSPEHYRQTSYHVDHLEKTIGLLTGEAQSLATLVLKKYETLNPLPEVGAQLIHGDPKLDNVLFKDGKPFSLIDWDTLMTESPFIDIGDAVRSLLKTQPDRPVFNDFVRGYYEIRDYDMSFDKFLEAALNAAKIIAADNAARYLYDIPENLLWQWQPSNHVDRESFLLESATKTWNVFEHIDNAKLSLS